MSQRSSTKKSSRTLERILERVAPYYQQSSKLFLVVFILGAVAILSSIMYWKININKPFLATNEAQERNAATALDDFSSLLAEQQADTDQDGLSDYYETNVYQTSPYIADSDSDGILDGEEVATGSNPNCPLGQTCGSEFSGSPVIEGPAGDRGLESLLDLPDPNAINEGFIGEFRDALIAEGIDRALLDSLSDEQLVSVFDQTTTLQEEGSVAVDDESTKTFVLILRQLLLQSGLDQASLDQLSDEAIVTAYAELLQTQSLVQ